MLYRSKPINLVAADRHQLHTRRIRLRTGLAEIMKEPSRLSGFLISGPQTCPGYARSRFPRKPRSAQGPKNAALAGQVVPIPNVLSTSRTERNSAVIGTTRGPSFFVVPGSSQNYAFIQIHRFQKRRISPRRQPV